MYTLVSVYLIQPDSRLKLGQYLTNPTQVGHNRYLWKLTQNLINIYTGKHVLTLNTSIEVQFNFSHSSDYTVLFNCCLQTFQNCDTYTCNSFQMDRLRKSNSLYFKPAQPCLRGLILIHIVCIPVKTSLKLTRATDKV